MSKKSLFIHKTIELISKGTVAKFPYLPIAYKIYKLFNFDNFKNNLLLICNPDKNINYNKIIKSKYLL